MKAKLVAIAVLVIGVVGAQAPPPAPIRVSPGVAQANRVTTVAPQYPQEAKADHVQGKVVLEVIIDKGGKVSQLSVVSGPAVLTEAAIEAVSQWEYKPTLLNGEPVDVITNVEVNFTLQ